MEGADCGREALRKYESVFLRITTVFEVSTAEESGSEFEGKCTVDTGAGGIACM